MLAVAALAMLPGCGSSPKQRALIVYEAQVGEAANVYTIDPQSGESRQLTHGTSFDGNPAWSPDRKRILFSSRRDGQSKNDLYTMDAGGGDVSRLTDTPDAGEWSAKFSRDGAQIAFVREADDGWSVWLMRADRSGAAAPGGAVSVRGISSVGTGRPRGVLRGNHADTAPARQPRCRTSTPST